ncbi:Small-conductance mechanosensitive channel [Maioricimonas rarisocia]|uniref:Small-conductance mechanosensitive channel n=1 Tax=Maioricimonas rarisocia TaxID=2528026 RepID=A0A517Z999_9PLAN|nr:mechanosensitive ion channel family protein [Maioricimonas rarisocia]QDU39055.1 Small-conductance mechanosensitive channel [Maioricimonas rarisocia]
MSTRSRRTLTLISLLLPLILIVCSAATARGQDDAASAEASTPDEVDAVPEQVQVDDVVSDEQIRDRLEGILTTTERFTNLDIEVRNSVVFLAGTTTKESHRDWAVRLARNTESVVAVVDNLEVKRQFDLSRTTNVVSESLYAMWLDALERSPLIVAGLFALLVTWLVSRITIAILRRMLPRARLGPSLQDLVLQLATIGIWLVGITVAAVIVFPGMTPAKVLTVLGLSSVAVGFAFKDIFENFFAGILILWKYPFDRGDFIDCGEVHGRIEEITIRMTMIRQVDGQLIVVPNSYLFKNPVDVLTSQPSRRVTIICGVAYGADLDESREVIRKAVDACETVKTDQPVQIFAQEFGASSMNFEVTWWTDPKPVDIRRSRDEVVGAVKRALDQAGIEIPFPQRTLWFPEPLATRRSDSEDEGASTG